MTMSPSGQREPQPARDRSARKDPPGGGLRIVHPDLSHGKPALLEPNPGGYLYIAASVRPGATPLVMPSARRSKVADRAKQLAQELERLEGVRLVSTFRAIAMPPTARFSEYLKESGTSVQIADYDVLVLVECSSIATAQNVRESAECGQLLEALDQEARHVRITLAHNEKRIAEVSLDRSGLFLFNHFVARDAAVMLELWEYLAGWYMAETGLRSSVALVPEPGDPSQYAIVNFARWETNPLHHFWSQLSKKSFWRFVTANLDANHAAAMPIYCRLV